MDSLNGAVKTSLLTDVATEYRATELKNVLTHFELHTQIYSRQENEEHRQYFFFVKIVPLY